MKRARETNAARFAEQKTYAFAMDVYLRDCFTRRAVVRTDTLADHLRTTREHLARRVAELFGRPLGAILRDRQIDEAKRLLISVPSLNLDDVAAASGFGTRTTLFRRFKATVGSTPTEYRRQAHSTRAPQEAPIARIASICDAIAPRLPRPKRDHRLQHGCEISPD